MRIILRGNFIKLAAMVLEVVAFLALVIWPTKTYVAGLVSRKATVQNVRRAIRLDPNNSEYRWKLGRVFQYSLTDIDPDQSVQQFSRATELNPYDAQPWLDLGAALEFQGKTAKAEACLRRADFLAPHLPQFQWTIGNFFLLHGNVDEAFRHFKVVLTGMPNFNRAIFNIAWKASGDASKILAEVIPNQAGTEFDYLDYLLSQKRYPEAQSVWTRIMAGSERFLPSQAAPYLDSLIALHQPDESYDAWSALIKKGLIPATEEETEQNRVVNGDFEEEPLNMGFDWRIFPVEGVYVGRDQTTFHSPGHALLIQFSGKENIHYYHVQQYVRVWPHHAYRLAWAMKTEGITTDSGPRMEVRDAYDAHALDQFSESLTGSTEGWSSHILDFTTGPKTELIIMYIVRLPSRKFDNQIAGKVWVDDVSLTSKVEEAMRMKDKPADTESGFRAVASLEGFSIPSVSGARASSPHTTRPRWPRSRVTSLVESGTCHLKSGPIPSSPLAKDFRASFLTIFNRLSLPPRARLMAFSSASFRQLAP